MKKNWLMRTAYLVLAVLLISSVVVSGTFAKYVWSSNEVVSSAEVALFQFKIGETTVNSAAVKDITIDLFAADNLLDENLDTGKIDGAEADVKQTEGETTKIAPGMGGSFDIVIQNLGEVTIAYELTVGTIEDNGIDIVYSLTNNGTDWTADLSTLVAGETGVTGVLNVDAAAVTETIYWKWAYEEGDDDAAETDLGFAGTATYEVPLTVTVTQVN